MLRHKTVAQKGSLSGVGLHTGAEATVTLVPAPEGYGIRFVRVDMDERPEIPADVDNVVGEARGTSIGIGDALVHTIEHLMAALAALRISNVRIELDAEELPLMDGSAKPFIDLINTIGIEEQESEQEFIVIDKPPRWLYDNGKTALAVFPAEEFYTTLMIDFANPVIGAQHTTIFNFDTFAEEFAPARTFCFLSEIEKLRELGLIKGGTLDSAVVVQDREISEEHAAHLKKLFNYEKEVDLKTTTGFLNNTELRFSNELCRHKAVDLVGDLYLLGKPIKGHILGARSGHGANHQLVKNIRKYYNTKGEA